MAILDFRGFSESTAIADFVTCGLIVPLLNGSPDHLFIGANGTFGDNYLALVSTEYLTVQAQMNWTVPTLVPFIGFRMGLKILRQPNPRAAIAFVLMDAAGNGQVTISINATDGSMRVFTGRASNGVQIASAAPGTFVAGTTRYVEIGANLSSVNGSVVVRLDGNTVVSVGNVSTVSNGAAPAIQSIMIENSSAYDGNPGGSSALILQHMYVNDNTGPAPLNGFLGDVRVTGQAYAAPVSTQFAPTGAATNQAVCATNPPVPATIRNVSTNVGDADVYTMQPLPPSTTAVFAVGIRTLAAKDAAGARSLKNTLLSGAVTASGGVVSLGITPAYVRDNLGVDPGTGGPWTVNAVNALRPGYVS